MAARKDLRHSDEVRKKIQTSQLVNRLTGHVNGKVKMTPTQVKAAEVLLRKSLPDLANVTLSGDPDNPLAVNSTLDVAKLTPEQLRALASIPVHGG